MKLTGLVVMAALVGGGVIASRGCLDKAPDEELAEHFDELCKIARGNVGSPEKGVRKIGRYLASHTGDMLGDLGETFEEIETIRDDKKHDARAVVARDRIQRPLRKCERDWQRFADAVESDPAARALVDHAMARLQRTFDIIFKGELEFRELPRQLERAFGETLIAEPPNS